MFLLTKTKAQSLKSGREECSRHISVEGVEGKLGEESPRNIGEFSKSEAVAGAEKRTCRIFVKVTPEVLNRFWTELRRRLAVAGASDRQGANVPIAVDISVSIDSKEAEKFRADIEKLRIDRKLEGKVELQ